MMNYWEKGNAQPKVLSYSKLIYSYNYVFEIYMGIILRFYNSTHPLIPLIGT
jgi:hypothetical protein